MTGVSITRDAAALPRLAFVERAKGLAILLVVFGHVSQTRGANTHSWYAYAKHFIYTFHMPLFLLLSGIVFFYSLHHLKRGSTYWRFVVGRANRLLVPFLCFAIVVVFGKFIATTVLGFDVADPVDNIIIGLTSAITNATPNPALSIWYLLVLFVYCTFTPALYLISGGKIYVLLLSSLALHFVVVGEEFYVARTLHYYFFFVLGGAIVTSDILYRREFGYITWVSLVLVLTSVCLFGVFSDSLLFYGSLVSILILWFSMRDFGLTDFTLRFLGSRSMVIYLLNTVVIGVLAAIFAPLREQSETAFVFYVLLLFVGGTFAPVFVRAILARIPQLAHASKYIS